MLGCVDKENQKAKIQLITTIYRFRRIYTILALRSRNHVFLSIFFLNNLCSVPSFKDPFEFAHEIDQTPEPNTVSPVDLFVATEPSRDSSGEMVPTPNPPSCLTRV